MVFYWVGLWYLLFREDVGIKFLGVEVYKYN